MNKIIELLNENADWYLNRSCLGESLERNPIEYSWCNKCGDYKGAYKRGCFIFFLKDALIDSLEKEMLNEVMDNPFLIVHLIENDYEITEYDLESDEYSAEEVVAEFLIRKGLEGEWLHKCISKVKVIP